MRRLLHSLYEYVALGFGLGLLGALSLTWTLFAVPLHLVLPKRVAHRLGRWVITMGFRFYLGTLERLGACRFDLREVDRLRGAGPMIIAPNHPCLLDAFFIISRLPDLACIMKASILDNIFLGAGARLAGYIRNDAPLDMIQRAVEELKSGRPLLLFPEGTRTVRPPVNAFKASTAIIAARAGVPVQTVFIETDSAYLSKGWPLFRKPAMPITYRVRLGRRFAPQADARAFTRELEHYFASELARAPAVGKPQGIANA